MATMNQSTHDIVGIKFKSVTRSVVTLQLDVEVMDYQRDTRTTIEVEHNLFLAKRSGHFASEADQLRDMLRKALAELELDHV